MIIVWELKHYPGIHMIEAKSLSLDGKLLTHELSVKLAMQSQGYVQLY